MAACLMLGPYIWLQAADRRGIDAKNESVALLGDLAGGFDRVTHIRQNGSID